MDSSFSQAAATSAAPSGDKADGLRSSLSVDILVYLAIILVLLGAWQISRMGWVEPGSDLGYWTGVAGAAMMVLLFSYPLRKHFRFARNWGPVKGWLMVHMVLGVCGPGLILVHSNFRVGSLNAAMALYSMLAVAVSGVIGRFIYARINRGLHGEMAELRDLQVRAGLEEADARSRLSFAPETEARLQAFGKSVLEARPGWSTYVRQVLWLPVQQWRTYRFCVSDLHHTLGLLAQKENWSSSERLMRERQASKLVLKYLHAVTRVAQFTAYERLFSLWHVAHIPFVYLLVICAVVHVISVYAY